MAAESLAVTLRLHAWTGAGTPLGWQRVAACLPLLLLAVAPPALAHSGRPLAPHDLWAAWSLEPWVLLGLGGSGWLYLKGTRRLWRRAGKGRGIPRWRFRAHMAGLAALFLALVSPLDAMGGVLFSAHMLQHEIIIVFAAPLLVLGTPLIAYLWALPTTWRTRLGAWGKARPVRGTWGFLSHPLTAWTLHAVALWIWHAPGLYQATVTSEPVHVAQHLSFLLTALLFWWAVAHPGVHRRLGYGLGVLYVFTTALHGSALGALLTFAPTAWYPVYSGLTEPWGLTLLEDQQLGGLIMWVPFGIVYTVAALALFAVWLRALERRSERAPKTAFHGSAAAVQRD